MNRVYSIRIPVHGFVEFSEWERDVINHSVFQRLRRIRQLAFSEHLYPGSVHTRLEHSLGVMHVATRLYDAIVDKCRPLLQDRLVYDPKTNRARTLVRLGALLHDVGHSPFSHSGEDLMPDDLHHEDYSAELIRHEMKDVIDDHPVNKKELRVTGEEIAAFYQKQSTISPDLPPRCIKSSLQRAGIAEIHDESQLFAMASPAPADFTGREVQRPAARRRRSPCFHKSYHPGISKIT